MSKPHERPRSNPLRRADHAPELHFYPYALALRQRWQSARDGFTQRHGWLLRLTAGEHCGYGDCAPLPAAGTETHATAAAALAALARHPPTDFAGSPADVLARLDDLLATAPAVRYALDCALFDLAARTQGQTLRALLAPQPQPRPADTIAVNAMPGTLHEVTPAMLAAAAQVGFSVFKLKIGLAAPHTEIAQLQRLATALPPGTRLRLDANGAWNLTDAATMIDALAGLPIEALEEPLQNPGRDTLARLQERADFALALDESLPALLDWPATQDPARLRTLGVHRLVLKPAAVGGLTRTLALARAAHTAGLEVVLTSLVESAAGLWPTAQLAAVVDGAIPHGLATAEWLGSDLGRPPRPHAGRIALPALPGSGFTPDAPDITHTPDLPGTI